MFCILFHLCLFCRYSVSRAVNPDEAFFRYWEEVLLLLQVIQACCMVYAVWYMLYGICCMLYAVWCICML
jgi:hypothetical protein